MNEKTLGKYLRDLRKEKGLTTRELGEKMNYSYSYVASLETGKRVPTDEVLEKYIYSLAANNGELKEIKKEISTITNGEYYQNYNQYDNDIFNKDNKVNSMNIDEGAFISEKIYDFPINDISFHLNDKYNTKFFEGFKLNDRDRKYIYLSICIQIKGNLDNELMRTIEKINLELEKMSFLKNEYSTLNERIKNVLDDNEKLKIKTTSEIIEEKMSEIEKTLTYLYEQEKALQKSIKEIDEKMDIKHRGA
ncbi:helix-turn-helix domain-containing protein [Staphylococcus hominis]|uniref:HTH cro/C1-type domain-containing protein n=1 Tax=Staphylococcus hominis TaxID=1290 RepID=A0A3S7GTC6_STAHO|nr:helix-turn-helix transcriptional regulator [Staphylococcus hominis]AVI05754.1 hypothetical protein AZE34_02885 [Staphylococcus hominis]MDU3976997.1 helix-turn-helix transcriptional regulator [Staphylococcus sp.]MDU3987921.1 helix-turn-helix transcriptional regulator [Staphylococcus sp.]